MVSEELPAAIAETQTVLLDEPPMSMAPRMEIQTVLDQHLVHRKHVSPKLLGHLHNIYFWNSVFLRNSRTSLFP
jgi:hypothetical protein